MMFIIYMMRSDRVCAYLVFFMRIDTLKSTILYTFCEC
jgi:hypothetical protein